MDIQSINQKIAELIKKKRTNAGLSQLKLCSKADLSLDTIRLLENDRKKNIQLETLIKLATAFDIKLWELLKILEI